MKVGLIGLGRWGKNHKRVLKELGVLHATCDHNVDESDYAEFREMLPEVDAVTICTPTDTHYEIAKYCLEQGKHVFVEKPISESSDQIRELCKIAQDKKLMFMGGMIYRFNPVVNKLKELWPTFENVHTFTTRYIHPMGPRKDSGAIINLGIHMIDTINHITNCPQLSVMCGADNHKDEKMAMLTFFHQGFYSTIEVNCIHPEKVRDMYIIGDDLKVYADLLNQALIINGETINIEKNNPLKDELSYFIMGCENKSEVDEPLIKDYERASLACLCARYSYNEGELLRI